ncbi:MAG: hypothetical protein EAZ53_12070 [Bacteroidetes bacterium]|nr:MAG: hypothetical protein EAZ53_12070 [Bacteroidota bacterium]
MKKLAFIGINIFSVALLSFWIFQKCLSMDTNFSTLIADFLALITCFYAMIRIIESKNGNFHVMDMVTIYYASLFFVFWWFTKLVYNFWDFMWGTKYDAYGLLTTGIVFFALLINFYAAEDQNMQNLDKIESDM